MADEYEAIIEERSRAFLAALDGAGRVTVHRANAVGGWDIQTFSPEAVKRAIEHVGQGE